jgi:UrcA family protein
MKTALALALLILPLAAAPLAEAHAASPFSITDSSPTTLTVSRADLDLTQPGDAAILLARAEKVAHSWCVEPGHQSRGTTSSCVRNVMADVVSRVDEPAVATAWTARGGAPVRLASN